MQIIPLVPSYVKHTKFVTDNNKNISDRKYMDQICFLKDNTSYECLSLIYMYGKYIKINIIVNVRKFQTPKFLRKWTMQRM